jgi:hypothetical protein
VFAVPLNVTTAAPGTGRSPSVTSTAVYVTVSGVRSAAVN